MQYVYFSYAAVLPYNCSEMDASRPFNVARVVPDEMSASLRAI